MEELRQALGNLIDEIDREFPTVANNIDNYPDYKKANQLLSRIQCKEEDRMMAELESGIVNGVNVERVITQRGFKLYKFKDAYRSECSLQKSSSVYPHIWLGMDKDDKGNEAHTQIDEVTQLKVPSRMHLSQRQVNMLLPLLKHFVDTGDLI